MRKKGIYIKRCRYKIKWKSILEGIISTGLLLGACKSLCIFIYLSTGYLEEMMPLVDYTDGSKYYYIINSIYASEIGKENIGWITLINGIVIIAIIAWILKNNSCEKLLIIEHSSLQRMSFTYNAEEIESYTVKRIKFNQYNTLNETLMTQEEIIKKVIYEVEAFIPSILDKVEKKGYQLGYAGIANIPATFLLGYELGDENKKRYFHKFRNDATDDDFHLLDNEHRQLVFEPNEMPNDLQKTGKILLIVQLTQSIKEEDLRYIKEENDYIIRYEIPRTIDYDVVDSVKQIDLYTNEIISRIRDLQKERNISEIKICIAASSAFIFALGTKFSKTQNIDTVIFHYQNDSYPWGINVSKKVPVIIERITK